jgi:hypothetical protein
MGNSTQIFLSNSATTGYQYATISNTGANLNFGIERSTGGALSNGSLAYASLIQTSNSTALQFGTNNNIRATIDASGNVGIGTVSPEVMLQLGENNSTNKVFSVRYSSVPLYINGGFDGVYALSTFSTNNYNTSSGSSSWGSFSNTNYSSSAVQLASSTSGAEIRFLTAAASNTNPTERMRITSGGKVNIANTTNTTYALSVYSTAQDTHIQAAGTAPSVRFSDTVTGATYSSLFGLATTTNNFTTGSVAGDFAITWNSANSLILGFSNTSTEKARMTSNGDLLLGTTTSYSGAKLVANGGIRTAAPSGTTAGVWKFGQIANFGVTANRVLYIEVDGVTYTLLASTTV